MYNWREAAELYDEHYKPGQIKDADCDKDSRSPVTIHDLHVAGNLINIFVADSGQVQDIIRQISTVGPPKP